MNKRRTIVGVGALVILAFILYLASVPLSNPDDETARMNGLKGPFSRLTQAVNSAVRYEQVPLGLTDVELLKFATASNSVLLVPLASYPIRIKQIGSATVLLLCSPDNKRALLEDISSTPGVDKERWRSNEGGCDFTINQVP